MRYAVPLIIAVLSLAAPSMSRGQVPPLVIAWQAPVGSDAAYGYVKTKCQTTSEGCLNCPNNSTQFTCFLSNVLPNISGVGFVIPWGEIDMCSSSGPCASDTNCHATGNCYSWAWIDNALMDFINASIGPSGSTKPWSSGCAGNRPCKIVLIVWLTQDSGNINVFYDVPNTPAYVFSQQYANTVYAGTGCGSTCAPQDVVVCKAWQGSNLDSSPQGWGVAAPIQDTCWATGGTDVGLWNAQGAHKLKYSGSCMSISSLTGNYSGYPVMYEKPIVTASQAFLSALALHYSPSCPNSYADSCGNGPTIAKSVAYLRVGPSSGGEDYPYCSSSSAAVYNPTAGCPVSGAFWSGPRGFSAEQRCFSDQGYLTSWPAAMNDGAGYISSLYGFLSQQSWAFPIDTPSHEGPPDLTSIAYADTEALLASQNGLGFGMQAASVGDLVTNATQYFPSSGANWAVHAREFPYVPVHHLQTMNPGNPTQAARFTIATAGISSSGLVTCTLDCSVFCTAPPWVYISGTSNAAFNGIWEVSLAPSACGMGTIQLTGTLPSGTSNGGYVFSGAHLPLLLPFETQNCHGSLATVCSAELWEETLDWAYGTNTVSSTGGDNGSGDPAYQTAIGNFLLGLPNATSMHNHMSTNAKQY